MNNDQEIILAKISAVYDKPPFVKMETGQMEMILKCVGLGAYYDKYREYLEPYWYNGRFQNPVESYRIFVGLNSIFEDLLNERKGDEIISLLTELGNYIPGTILSDEARFAADFNKLRQLYNLMGLQIVSMEVDEYSSKFQVEPYLNEGNQIIQSFGMERWLKSKYQDVYEAYESALNSFSSGDLGAAIESCRTALTGIFSKYKGVPFQKAKWMLGMATLTGDFTGTQSADASEMTSIKNEIEAMGKRDIADFFEENLEGSYKKTKAIYSIYSMLSDYGTHRLEGTVEVAKNEDGDTMPDLPANAIPVFYGDDYMDLPFFLSEIAVTRLQRMAGLRSIVSVNPYALFLEKCKDLVRLLDGNRRIAMCCCQNYGRLMHLQLYENQATEIQQEWNSIVEILKQCNYDEDICKTAVSAANEYFHTLIQRKKDDELAKLEDSMDQVHQESGLCEAAEIAALCLANLYKSGGQRKITPEIYEKVKKYLRNFPESMRIRAAFIITSEAIYSQSAEYKRVPDRIINDANKWSMQYPSEIEFQEGYFGLLFSRLKYAQEQDMRNEQRRVFREMKKVAGRANYSEYNEHNQLMDTVEIDFLKLIVFSTLMR